ncbi:twin-arginine translocation signal domain-containing protein, partial [Streptomyces sp. NPDC001274]
MSVPHHPSPASASSRRNLLRASGLAGLVLAGSAVATTGDADERRGDGADQERRGAQQCGGGARGVLG